MPRQQEIMVARANCKRLGIVILIAVNLLVVPIAALGQMTTAPQASPQGTVSQFCKLDAEGKQLTSEAPRELVSLLANQVPRDTDSEITVIKDYVVRASDARGSSANVTVDYSVWGRIDSSLRFTALGGNFGARTTPIAESFTVVRVGKPLAVGTAGQSDAAKDAAEWKISRAPFEPYVSIATAMGYVRQMSFRSRDQVVEMNAQQTLFQLQNLLRVQSMPATFAESEPQSPMAVLSQFIALEADGRGLTPDGLPQLQGFFVHPPSWGRDKIRVARSYAVKSSKFGLNSAELYVEYMPAGELDSLLRFTTNASDQRMVREDYALVMDNKYSLRAHGNAPAREFTGPARWRIEDAHPEQWITVNAAIRYVTQMRDAATDPAVKSNAQQTLATLARYR